jgi:hypothetical protein
MNKRLGTHRHGICKVNGLVYKPISEGKANVPTKYVKIW